MGFLDLDFLIFGFENFWVFGKVSFFFFKNLKIRVQVYIIDLSLIPYKNEKERKDCISVVYISMG